MRRLTRLTPLGMIAVLILFVALFSAVCILRAQTMP